MKIMIVNSKAKHMSRIMLGVNKKSSSWFHSAYMRNYPILVTATQDTTQNTLEEVSKKSFMTNNLQQ